MTEPILEVVSPRRWAGRAADLVSAALRNAVRERGAATLAISGGSTPAPFFTELARRVLPWDSVTLVQVDEREAPPGSPDRNLTDQRQAFGALPVRWLPLPVERSVDSAALKEFVVELRERAGDPPVIDVVHLGLGSDGHTASLVPGDPVLDESHHVIARTAEYGGTHRLTITAPTLSRARLVLWLVRGVDKTGPLGRLLADDRSIPATLVRPERSVIVATDLGPLASGDQRPRTRWRPPLPR